MSSGNDLLLQENASLKKENKTLTDEINLLKNTIKILIDSKYGRKSEKMVHEDPNQKLLFDSFNVEAEEPKKEFRQDDFIVIEEHKRLKKGRREIPKEMPKKENIIKLPENETICEFCKEKMTLIGYEPSNELDFIQAVIQLLVNKREKFVCKNPECECNKEGGKANIKVAPPVPKIVPKSILSNNLLAYIAAGKFEDANPYYRLEKMTGRYGFSIPRSTMSSLMIKAANNMEAFMKLWWNKLLESHYLGIDETHVQVIEEPEKPPGSKSYMWVFRGGTAENPIIYFRYSPSRNKELISDLLSGFQGKIQSDGYNVYSSFAEDKGLTHYCCWAHARREFHKILKVSKGHEGANWVLKRIHDLYRVEKQGKKERLLPEKLSELRIEKSLPVLNELKIYLDEKKLAVPEGTDFGNAINYVLRRWNELTGYVNDGMIPIDNNLVENSIRPFVVGRKNWLFNYNENGAFASAVFYTIVETAKASKLDPYSYMCLLFNELPKLPEERYHELLPMNVDHLKVRSYCLPPRYQAKK
jgi:transposase